MIYIFKISKKFNDGRSIKFLWAWIIMILFSLFFFYYNFVFCAVYVWAMNGWVYSGIWCMIMVWFAFAPAYIMALTTIEKFCGEEACRNVFMFMMFCFHLRTPANLHRGELCRKIDFVLFSLVEHYDRHACL